MPRDGLAKYFAAFSNTRGGVIIVGVEENRQTGLPTAWDGIPEDAQQIERVYQWASNVDPIPKFEVHATDVQNGNFFILIRILEGDMTPYYVQNDANVYVRTGNITPSIDIASPDMLELLFGKKEKAGTARHFYERRAQETYDALLRRAERERLLGIQNEKEEYKKKREQLESEGQTPPPYLSRYYNHHLGSEASILNIWLQPFYPKQQLWNPRDIKNKTLEIRDFDKDFRLRFPSLNQEAIQYGVSCFEWGEKTGEIDCDQIYATGLIRKTTDVLRVENGFKKIYVYWIFRELFEVLKAASNYYALTNYQGGVVGKLILSDIEGVHIDETLRSGGFFPRNIVGLMPEMVIDLDIDTSILGDVQKMQSYFKNVCAEIFWSLGCGELNEKNIDEFLRLNNWFVE